MQIYSDENIKNNYAVGFEIDSFCISIGVVIDILNSVNGVSDIKKRKLFSQWDYVHIRFKYLGHNCIVMEPFGDSSRYWIGLESPKEFDFSLVSEAFIQYKQPRIIKFLCDLITLKFLRFY